MTLMAFLLLIILFLVAFLYFSGLNPQEVTIYYLPDQSITFSVGIIVIGCVLVGLIIGYLIHIYSTVNHLFGHWKKERVEKKSREVSTLYREGVARFLSGDLKKARTLLQTARDRDPSRVDILIALANVHLQEGEAQEGVKLLLNARTLAPRSTEVLFKLADAYEEERNPEEALRTYDEILLLERDNRKALRGKRTLHIAAGQWRDALELQKRIVKTCAGTDYVEEENALILFLRYEVARLAVEEGEVEQGKSELKQIIREAPDFTPARVSLGDALRAQNRFEEACRTWQEGYQAQERSIFLSRLEDLAMETETPSALLAFYRSALMDRGSDLMLRLFFGKLCLRLEMVDEAMEHLSEVESAGVDIPQLHLLLAEVHRRRDRIEEAVQSYRRALKVGQRLQLGYLCDACQAPSPEWKGSCPECGTWGSLTLDGRRDLRASRPLEMLEIHHGERNS